MKAPDPGLYTWRYSEEEEEECTVPDEPLGEPVVVDDQIVIRPMMYLALSYDHRIVDGEGAVTFLVHVKEALEEPARLLLEI